MKSPVTASRPGNLQANPMQARRSELTQGSNPSSALWAPHLPFGISYPHSRVQIRFRAFVEGKEVVSCQATRWRTDGLQRDSVVGEPGTSSP
jgi:hypothetical protein